MLRCRVSPPTSPGALPPARTRVEAPSPKTVAAIRLGRVLPRYPGKVSGGQNGDVAADHYHLWRTDVALMADLGLTAYRFSIAWPRVQPRRQGPANEAKPLDYDRLTDALLARGHHPGADPVPLGPAAAARGRGRLAARDTAHQFAEYAGAGRGDGSPTGFPAMDHPERGVRGHGVRLRARRARAGADADARRAADRPPPASRARAGHVGAAVRRSQAGGDHQQPLPLLVGHRQRGRHRGGEGLRQPAQLDVRRPPAARPLPSGPVTFGVGRAASTTSATRTSR